MVSSLALALSSYRILFLTSIASIVSLKEGIRELVDTTIQIWLNPSSDRALVCRRLRAARILHTFCFSNHRQHKQREQSPGHRGLGLEMKSSRVSPHQQGLSGGSHVWLCVQSSQSRAK